MSTIKRNLASDQGIGYSIFNGNKLTQNDVTAITNYANAVKSGVKPAIAMKENLKGCSVAGLQYVKTSEMAGQSTDEMVAGLKDVPKATNAMSASLEVLSIAGNMLISMEYTSNDGDTDENNGKYFAGNVVKASAHYFVDDDSITQSVPDDYVAWSVGGKKYSNCNVTGGGKYYGIATNANTLNIEIGDDVKNGVVYPSAATIQNAIEFTKIKIAQYNLSKEHVIRHFDVTGKSCPAYWVDDAKWKAEFWDKLSDKTSTTRLVLVMEVKCDKRI